MSENTLNEWEHGMIEQLQKAVSLLFSKREGDPKVGFLCIKQLKPVYRQLVDELDVHLREGQFQMNDTCEIAIITLLSFYELDIRKDGFNSRIKNWRCLKSIERATFIPQGNGYNWDIWSILKDKLYDS